MLGSSDGGCEDTRRDLFKETSEKGSKEPKVTKSLAWVRERKGQRRSRRKTEATQGEPYTSRLRLGRYSKSNKKPLISVPQENGISLELCKCHPKHQAGLLRPVLCHSIRKALGDLSEFEAGNP